MHKEGNSINIHLPLLESNASRETPLKNNTTETTACSCCRCADHLLIPFQKNPLTGSSSFGDATTDGWKFGAYQIDASNNWASGGTNNVLIANTKSGGIYHDFASDPLNAE